MGCMFLSENDKLQHEMYSNDINAVYDNIMMTDKLQHEMYWNGFSLQTIRVFSDKLQHEMYWNAKSLWY